ncbi:DUF2089 family protein [Mesonia ostreae]|uniref:DUF2089 family protein n=1 Tax=Mesonia ostreae TaxID=861110 RepID=A0ABU2KF57_9FLAO|nr:DUF2089 family protein [Mesonia ostreae]MDT0293329.1 DUF2089 family protein [Mesonia ostreae]
MKKLPVKCPSCAKSLKVSQLSCEACDTIISGSFDLPVLANLPREDQQFILDFMLSGGSLKKMATQLNKSYPTVRNMLDEIIEKLNQIQQ